MIIRTSRGATGVVDCEQIAFIDGGALKATRLGLEPRLIVQPPIVGTFQGHPVPDVATRVADRLDRLEVVGVGTDNRRPAVPDDVFDLAWLEPEVDRNQHRSNLWHGIERLELRVGIRREVGDAVALPHPQALQRGRPAIAAVKELPVGEPDRPVDDGLAVRVEGARPTLKLERCQRRLHGSSATLYGFGPTVFRSMPTCSSSTSTTSPGCIALVAPGVPVKIMSPASSVTYRDT